MVKLANDNAIVMVDDNEGDIFLAETCFQRSRLRVPWLSFSSGRALIAYLQEVKQGAEPMPALVLLDINMPEMSGIEVLRHLREDAYFDQLPVICMLTSSSEARDRDLTDSLGARDFFTKPSTTAEYVALFNSFAPTGPESLEA